MKVTGIVSNKIVKNPNRPILSTPWIVRITIKIHQISMKEEIIEMEDKAEWEFKIIYNH